MLDKTLLKSALFAGLTFSRTILIFMYNNDIVFIIIRFTMYRLRSALVMIIPLAIILFWMDTHRSTAKVLAITATPTNTVTASPVPFVCPDASNFKYTFAAFEDSGLVKINFTNNYSTGVSITGFTLNWRSAFAGMRLVYVYGSDPSWQNQGMWWGNDSVPPTSGAFDQIGWLDMVTVNTNSSKEIYFDFDGTNGKLSDLGAVSNDFNGSTLTILNNCVVTIQPDITTTPTATFTASLTSTSSNTPTITKTPTNTNTPTVTQTASRTATVQTATPSITSTATATVCPGISGFTYQFLTFQDLGLVKMVFSNSTNTATQIVGFTLNWRVAFPGISLARVYVGGNSTPYSPPSVLIWQGSDSTPPSGGDEQSLGWQNSVTIPANTASEPIWFDFEGTFDNLGSYGIIPGDFNGSTLKLTNNCVVTIQSNPTPTPTQTSTPPPPRKDTIGVYKNGVFYLRNSNTTGVADIITTFGGDPSDLPVVGDWNNDGVDTIGIYRNSTGFFFLSDSNTTPNVDYTVLFGNPGDTPFAGHWTADTSGSGIGVYRNSNGILYQRKSLTSGFDDFFAIYGNPGDIGFAGDWNGDGFDSVGIYRPDNQTWYLSNNSTPTGITFSDINFVWYASGIPVVGDWDGNGTSTIGHGDAVTGLIVLNNANAAPTTLNIFPYGPTGGKPIAGKWVAPGRPPQVGNIIGGKPGSSINPVGNGEAD